MNKPEKKLRNPKVLFISGSPRNGNTEYVLKKLSDSITSKNELFLLRDKEIAHCKGCLGCHMSGKCVIHDDMDEINQALVESDFIVIGSPNYFDNVSGLLKDFIDRTHPLYQTEKLAGKKILFILVGGGKPAGTKEILSDSLAGFIKYQKLDLVGSFAFQSLNVREIKKYEGLDADIEKIAELIN